MASDPSRVFRRRLALLSVLAVAAAGAVLARLAWLQVVQSGEYRELARRQQLTPREAHPNRGFLMDRNGEVLALNVDLYNVYAHPRRVSDKPEAARVLAAALGKTPQEILRRLSEDRSFVWLARQVPFERSERVEKLRIPGVGAYREQRRFYPNREMAAHVLGFAGLDNQGLEGLEKAYDHVLSGKKGFVFAERDARGRVLDRRVAREAVEGLHVVTTLDKTIQHVAQVELEKAFRKYRCESATVIVMDPSNGDILALANYPAFDPNAFRSSDPSRWRNRAVQQQFEPGSTFKLVVAAAALEEGVFSEEDRLYCENGKYEALHGRIITDHEKHGWLTFREVFGYSSNIGMVKVGSKLGAEVLYHYARRFGFGEPTGVDLPGEARGLLRPPSAWTDYSLTSIPYGYELSATPLQVLAAYAAVANGGVRMKPRLVQRLETDDGRVVRRFEPEEAGRACSRRTARRLTEMLEWAVKEGTGKAVALPGYAIAGKTGTAHKLMVGRYSRYNYVSSFVGFVPADEPRFAIYVSLDDPRGLYWGGYTAGPVFKEVAKRVLAYAAVPSREVETRKAEHRVVPAFRGLTREQARRVAERAGLEASFEGEGRRVAAQEPAAGTRLGAETEEAVRLVLGDPGPRGAGGVMPDLRGKTKRQALALLAPLGVSVQFRGRGRVREQFPPPGRRVSAGAHCDLACEAPALQAEGPPAAAGKGS